MKNIRQQKTTSQSIFVVEDDRDIAGLIEHTLISDGFQVTVFPRGENVIAAARMNPPAMFLFDVMLPGISGMELCRQVRSISQLAKIPVMFLTAKNAEADKIMGLEIGADDYITKPFSPRELTARIRAVIRRFESSLPMEIIRTERIEIDTGAMIVKVAGQLMTTTATEFRLLAFLASNPGRVYTRDQLLDAVWRDTAFVTPRSVDVYVRRLREKIEVDPDDPRSIVTVRGAGYRFEAGA